MSKTAGVGTAIRLQTAAGAKADNRGEPRGLPFTEKDAMMTLEELFAAYLADSASNQEASTHYHYRCFGDWLVRGFGNRPLTELTPDLLSQWKLDLTQRCKPATVHKYLSRLGTVLDFAVDRDWLPRNPLAKIRKPSLSGEGRVRYLME